MRKSRVGIRYAKADISKPLRHDAYFDGGNWKVHEFFDWYQQMACRLCWKFSSTVDNFPSFLRNDAAHFWNRNVDNPAIAELLKLSLKGNRPVLVLMISGQRHTAMRSVAISYNLSSSS